MCYQIPREESRELLPASAPCVILQRGGLYQREICGAKMGQLLCQPLAAFFRFPKESTSQKGEEKYKTNGKLNET